MMLASSQAPVVQVLAATVAVSPTRNRLQTYLPPWWVLVLVPLVYVGTLAAAIYVKQLAQLGSHPLFPAPAIIVVALLRNRPATWPALLLVCSGCELAAGLDRDFTLTALTSIVDLSEGLLTAVLLRWLGDLRTWYLSIRWFVLCICCSFAAIALVCSLGVVAVYALGHPFWAEITPILYLKVVATDGISVLLATPLLLSWTEPALRHHLRSWQLAQSVTLVAAVAGCAAAGFLLSNSIAPLFLIFPLLSFLTLRSGLPGATAGAVAITVVGALFTANGIGPIATYPGLGAGGRILFLQLYFVAAILSSIPIAVILTLRAALVEKVKEQGAISDAALSNMAQGLSMFDQHDRLITCNRRFAELYNLPDHLTVPMTPLQEIVEHHGQGDLSSTKLKNYIGELLSTGDPSRSNSEIKLPDGRVISIHCRPLEDGGWVATHEDVTERRLAEERIAFLANHDPLTGLSNRTHFGEQLRMSLARIERDYSFALHALDLDRFKAVNDTFGHAAGDELLKQVAARLRDVVRKGDVITRLGGDEFAILQLSLKKPEEAAALASRIVQVLSVPFPIGEREVGIGTSIGIALAPDDTSDPAELMQKSDLALYRAKAEGRNTYRFYEPGMNAVQQARRVMETELRLAIKNGEFELHYQPIVDAKESRIDCFEALIRWRHPTRGLVQPDEFIQVAEESGLIQAIGEFVLRTACHEAASWPESIKVAVNLSPVQFKSPNLVSLIVNALAQAQLPPRRLELEITESALLQNSEVVLKGLHQLRAMGVSIAMDDFGTGYSSLSYLRSFPFDKIKIDRSFVADLTTRNENYAIVHAAIELSGCLGMASTAEGVETIEEYEALQAEGCTYLQGYYINRPVPAVRVPEILARYREFAKDLPLAS